jgi:protein YibB
MMLPNDLSSIARQVWPSPGTGNLSDNSPKEPHDIAVVTAFFDTNRERWRTVHLQRTNERYLEYFAHLARLRNHLIVFTEPQFVSRVLDLRRAHGLEDLTVVFEIDDLFGCELLAPLVAKFQERMSDRFHRFTWQPELPEYWEPRYVLINALKSAFVCTALERRLIAAPQVAWIDFGYCRDGKRFDPERPWRFDTRGKINLFQVNPLDDTPIFQVVRSGTVYFHGASIVGPATAWPEFAREISLSLFALLECGLIDDDQTLLLMAWRRDPSSYVAHPVTRADWFVVFRRFDVTSPQESVALDPLRRYSSQPAWLEEARVALRHEGKVFKRRLRHWTGRTKKR